MPPLLSRWVFSPRPLRVLPWLRPYRANTPKLVASYATVKTSPPPQQIRLRDYQEECIQAVLASLKNGSKRLGISLATGAGKTVIFTQLIDRLEPISKDAKQTLILAHRRELVEQAARHCSNAYPGKTVEIEMGNIHASGLADITIASIQSITSGDRLDKYDPARFKLVLVDEAHHIVAPGYLRTLEHFGLAQKTSNSPALVGVSATFSRFDGLRLGAAIDEIVYHKDYVDMIGEKWLADVIFTTVESTADLSKVKSGSFGDYQPGELSRAVNTEEINEITVRSWLAKAKGRKSTLVFCVDLAHVTSLTQAFRQHGIDAHFVTGDTPKVERSDRLDAFKRGEFPVLVNCGVFTEGTDVPNIDCVILARPTRSRNLLVQMIGRGMRLHPGKKNCHIIDMVSSLSTGIVSTPTLFGLDPSEIVEEASVDDMKDTKRRREEEAERNAEVDTTQRSESNASNASSNRNVTFTEYDSVFDLITDSSGERHIRSISPLSWVQVNNDKYILSGPEGSYIRLVKESEDGEDEELKFAAYEIRALPANFASKSPYAAPRRLLQANSFADAVHGSDSYALEKYPRYMIWRNLPWRRGEATPGQLKFLNKLRNGKAELTASQITKGKAADMIVKLKHGAKGRFATIAADKRRKERHVALKEQEKQMRLREQVSVGPLSA
ncbi:P-loop containing nucleoside triphosphate hydrolase protein [Xylariomycetidae sp. FL0641]|nr:P-loop containing nucleoside triphosphate hydrolase protein [Xylariomycetidae sp. FL0641]